MVLRSLVTVFVLIAAGCTSVQPTAKPVAREIWTNSDSTEFFTTYRDKELGLYLNNNANRLCYSYIIPGQWLGTNESALLRAEDGQATAGVLLYSALDLKDFEGPDLVARAAKLITKVYEKSVGQSIPAELEPFETQQAETTKWIDSEWRDLLGVLEKEVTLFQPSRSGAMKWSSSWKMERAGERFEAKASKIFLEIAPGWIAQITVNPDDDALARSILETLRITSDPQCYWPFIRKHYPNVR